MNETSTKLAEELRTSIEVNRREPGGTMSSGPLPEGNPDFDWGTAGTKIDFAVTHLDEALPNGQAERCRHAFMLLRMGVEELGCWLRANGVKV